MDLTQKPGLTTFFQYVSDFAFCDLFSDFSITIGIMTGFTVKQVQCPSVGKVPTLCRNFLCICIRTYA